MNGRTVPERLARVETKVEHHSEKLEEFRVETRGEFAEVRSDVASVRRDVSEIKDILTQAKGGWRVFLAIGSIAGSVGAFLMWLASKFGVIVAGLPR